MCDVALCGTAPGVKQIASYSGSYKGIVWGETTKENNGFFIRTWEFNEILFHLGLSEWREEMREMGMSLYKAANRTYEHLHSNPRKLFFTIVFFIHEIFDQFIIPFDLSIPISFESRNPLPFPCSAGWSLHGYMERGNSFNASASSTCSSSDVNRKIRICSFYVQSLLIEIIIIENWCWIEEHNNQYLFLLFLPYILSFITILFENKYLVFSNIRREFIYYFSHCVCESHLLLQPIQLIGSHRIATIYPSNVRFQSFIAAKPQYYSIKDICMSMLPVDLKSMYQDHNPAQPSLSLSYPHSIIV